MDRMLKIGMAGPDVGEAQSLLNQRPPSQLPSLVPDGQFGPRTLARVQEFQRKKSLAPDGIVGPKTWAALRNGAGSPGPGPGPSTLPAVTANCGVGDPETQVLMLLFQKAFNDALRSLPPSQAARLKPSNLMGIIPALIVAGVAGSQYLNTLSAFNMTTQHPIVSPVFGSSVDYCRVYVSTLTGASSRPFVAAFPVPTLSIIPGLPSIQFVQIMHLGTKSLDRDTLVHEMTHVWQSQHHLIPTQFMKNASLCQATALALNLAIGATDPTVKTRLSYPTGHPMSAYAYRYDAATNAAKPFGDYGAEQIATMVERGEATICSHVKGVTALANDADNSKSLKNNNNVEDLRVMGVKI